MTSGRLTRILATVLSPIFWALPSSASASSLFVLDHASPVRATVQLDFTIIIPETLLIGSGPRTAEQLQSSPRDASLNLYGANINAPKRSLNDSFHIVSNAGTLAFGPNPYTSSQRLPRQTAQIGQAEGISVSYLVSMP